MGGVFSLLFTKLTLPPASVVQGRTVLITGANTGLGREAARHAARLGAGTIILGVRSETKGEEAKKEIEASTGCSGKTELLVWSVDLGSFTSVREFAARARQYVTEEGGRIDVAIMNAGIASVQFARTGDGWERGLQVNALATAQLALHLMPLLLLQSASADRPSSDNSNQPHLVFVTSDSHMTVKFPERHDDNILGRLNDEEAWKASQAAGGPIERYAVTKLIVMLFADELARRTPRYDNGDDSAEGGRPRVVVNSVAPGFCKSDLLTREETPWVLRLIQALIARTAEEGSKTLLHGAAQGPKSHGKYLDHQAIAE